MKKIATLLVFALLLCLPVGCSREKPVAPGAGSEAGVQPLEGMPTMEELQKFAETHNKEQTDEQLRQVKKLLDETSQVEINEIIEESLNQWAKEQTLVEIDHVSIEFTRDALLMNPESDQRAYQNLRLKVGVYYDPAPLAGTEQKVVDEIFNQVPQALKSTPYGRFQIHTIDLACYSTGDVERYSTSIGAGTPSDIWVGDVPAQEQQLQTLAYEFIKEYNDTEFGQAATGNHATLVLKRYGIAPGSRELKVEVSGFLQDTKDVAAFQSSVEGKTQALYEKLIAEPSSVESLEKSQVETITISYDAPSVQPEYITFSYPLHKAK